MHLFVACLFLFLPVWILAATNTNETYSILQGLNITKPGCLSKCGNLTVPYPFGIGEGCFIPGLDITCNFSFVPPKPFLGTNVDLYDISDAHLRISSSIATMCYNESGAVTQDYPGWTTLGDGPFTFSDENVFTLIGCDDMILMSLDEVSYVGCASQCSNVSEVRDGVCNGNGCCNIRIPKGQKSYNASLFSFDNHTLVNSFNPCTNAFLGEKTSFKFQGAIDLNDDMFRNRTLESVSIVLDWAVKNLTCDEAKLSDDYACKENSICVDSEIGYRCNCMSGYEGNPYIDIGCKDIDECADPSKYICVKKKFPVEKFFIGIGFGVLFLLLIVLCWLHFGDKKRKLIKMREKFFQQNGGFLLKQQINSNEGGVESTNIFTAEELEKATNNYAEDRILGQGGYGTVYKGIMPDERIIAIKKSKVMDKSQVDQFINEVIILTQVNHRNVVKLLGCCLESEVPLLVYEYISNGTVFDHLYDSKTYFLLSWEIRLRIASEAAGAIAYLHSAASKPIIHRDIKSQNILLDDNYTTKVSDFGASRLVPLDQTQVSTLVQGTLGYLDPGYFNTSQLTEKSDVYSFGVVLAELLTGKKPICMDRNQDERNLATYLIKSMKEDRLLQILDPHIVKEGSIDQFQKVAELTKTCLYLNGEDRPTMKEVAMELETLRKSNLNTKGKQQAREEVVELMSENQATEYYYGAQQREDQTTQSSPYTYNSFSGQYSLEIDSIPMMFSSGKAR